MDPAVAALQAVLTAVGARGHVADLILFLTFSVILATLVLQGLSLPALMSRKKLRMMDWTVYDIPPDTAARHRGAPGVEATPPVLPGMERTARSCR